eukprot:SM000023S07571  [mRNA]  locus=s23:237275:239822:+ [translate_table: standard]
MGACFSDLKGGGGLPADAYHNDTLGRYAPRKGAAADKLLLLDGHTAAKQILLAEQRRDAELAALPGRTVAPGAVPAAALHTQQGKKGPNQDAMIVWQGYLASKNAVLCAAFDGHGPQGHRVAARVRDSLPTRIADLYKAAQQRATVAAAPAAGNPLSSSPPEDGPGDGADAKVQDSGAPLASTVNHSGYQPAGEKSDTGARSLWEGILQQAFKAMDAELRTHPGINCYASGTTAVMVIHKVRVPDFAWLRQNHLESDLIVANLGDSRAVMGSLRDGVWVATQLTVDQKPNVPEEAARIKACNGRVYAPRDEPDVWRVFLPNEEWPGLAMARAFGDMVLKDHGVTATPAISSVSLASDGSDVFIVLATDGVWDVLSNEEVVNIVAASEPRSSACQNLVATAVGVWREKFPMSKIDDCAAVCYFLTEDKGGDPGALSAPVTANGWSTAAAPALEADSSTTSSGGSPGDSVRGGRAMLDKAPPGRPVDVGSLKRQLLRTGTFSEVEVAYLSTNDSVVDLSKLAAATADTPAGAMAAAQNKAELHSA